MALEQIGKYKILSKIGDGPMGEVYEAHDPLLDRRVAITTIPASQGDEGEARDRFLREAQSAARLSHANIITVYDFGEESGSVYVATEFLKGQDLKSLMDSRSPEPLEARLRLMEQICDGLAFAHAAGVLHRDLQPTKIHVQPSGHVKILGFGLTRRGQSGTTRTGVLVGLPNYLSPERVRGERADARSDVFSAGVIFYELLTRHRAFDADSLAAVLVQVRDANPVPMRVRAPELPEALVRFVETALEKDPTRRYQHAGEMREALKAARRAVMGAGDSGAQEPLPVLEAAGGRPEQARRAPLATGSRPGTAAVSHAGRSLGGRAASGAASAAPPPPRAALGRLPLYVAGGVALLGAAAAALYLSLPHGTRFGAGPSPGPDVAKEQVGALTDALVAGQVDLARENLKDKNYKDAVVQAERALQLDPTNSDAKQVRDKARGILREAEAAAGEARTALAAGDPERASRALAKVLSIDPSHPVADELSARLNRFFQAQAEEARRAMRTSQLDAERAKAASQAPFVDAAARAGEAEAAFAKAEFTVAARKFLEARDGFERARRSAETPPVPKTPAPTVAPPTFAPPVAPPQTTLAPVTLPPITAPPATAPPATAPPTEEPAIRKLVEDYGRAIQSRDVALFRTVKPNLSGDEEKRLRDLFKAVKSYQVNVAVVSLQIDGDQAKVRVSRRDTIDGKPVNFQQTLVLTKGPGGWTIRDIGQ